MASAKRPSRLTITTPLTPEQRRAEAVLARAAIYCRISYVKDANEVGVTTQEQDCRDTCTRMGLEVAEVFVDNSRSAWSRNRKRPGWDAMLQAAREGKIDSIVAWHPDRLMRQPRDLEDLLDIAAEKNIKLVGRVGGRDLSNPDDVFILRIEVAHACRSSDDTSRRVKRGMARIASEGKHHGGRRTFGYGDDHSIKYDEAELIREAVTAFLANKVSLRMLAGQWNEAGVETVMGAKWWPNTLRVLFSSPKLAGYRVHNGQVVAKGNWQPILDEQTWERLQDRLATRAEVYDTTKERFHEYSLRGVVVCALCKRPMGGETTGGQPYYRCRRDANRGTCGGIRIAARRTEELCEEVAKRVLAGEYLTSTEQLAQPETEDMRAEIAELQATLVELSRRLGTRKMTMAEYDAAAEPLRLRLQTLNSAARPKRVISGRAASELLTRWNTMSVDEKNQYMRAIFDRVQILPAAPGANRYDRDRVQPEINAVYA